MSVPQFKMSLKESDSNWNVTQIGTSLQLKCHLNWNVIDIEYHLNWNVTLNLED